MRWWCSGSPAVSARSRGAATTFTVQAFVLLGALTLFAPFAHAQNDDQALKSTLETRLAFIVTGDAEADLVSKAGLDGLTRFLAQRTALEGGDPVGLDPARDELAFYPLIYWPIVPGG